MRWTLNEGDCLEIMPSMASKSVDMILCDLPYGTTACKWDIIIPLDKLWEQYKRIIKDNGAIVLTALQPFTTTLISSNMDWFKYELIWNKQQGKAPGVAKYRPMPSHENILIFGKNKTTYNPQWEHGTPYIDSRTKISKRNQDDGHKFGYNGIFTSSSDGRRYPLSIVNIKTYSIKGQHPTQKPAALFEYLIKTYTNENDLVLDNCAGSGTTGVACYNTNRDCIMIEKEPEYCEVIKKRMAEVTSQGRLI